MGAISYVVQLDPVVVGVPGLVVLQFQVVQLQVEQFAGIAHVRHCVRVCVLGECDSVWIWIWEVDRRWSAPELGAPLAGGAEARWRFILVSGYESSCSAGWFRWNSTEQNSSGADFVAFVVARRLLFIS